jgi:hypothetical protein
MSVKAKDGPTQPALESANTPVRGANRVTAGGPRGFARLGPPGVSSGEIRELAAGDQALVHPAFICRPGPDAQTVNGP